MWLSQSDNVQQLEQWQPTHARWAELVALTQLVGEARWLTVKFEWHQSSHVLVALVNDTVAGYLRFVVQPIGADAGCELVQWRGAVLNEAKVLGFGVLPQFRRLGIGRNLQQHAIQTATKLGCYQLRSHSSGKNIANHQLKLSMGFAVHPVERNGDKRGAYFILPLKSE